MKFFLEFFDFGELTVGFFVESDISLESFSIGFSLPGGGSITRGRSFVGRHQQKNADKDRFQRNTKGKQINIKIQNQPDAKPKGVKKYSPPAS